MNITPISLGAFDLHYVRGLVPMDTSTTFGEWVRKQRIKSGLTQELLGKAVGVSKAQINRIEKGEQGTPADKVVKIAAVTNSDRIEALRLLAEYLKVRNAKNEIASSIQPLAHIPASEISDSNDLIHMREGDRFVVEATMGDKPPFSIKLTPEVVNLLEALSQAFSTEYESKTEAS